MSVSFCSDCHEVFDLNFAKGGFCPKASCNGQLIEVDELIMPTIIMLNEKGYATAFCCSGHFYQADRASNCYIKFSEDYSDVLGRLPEGFVWEDDNTIRKNFAVSSEREAYFAVMETAKDLYLWAESLDDYDEDKEDNLAF